MRLIVLAFAPLVDVLVLYVFVLSIIMKVDKILDRLDDKERKKENEKE